MLLLLLIGIGLGYYGKNIQDTTREYHIESMNLSYGSPNAGFSFENDQDILEYSPVVASYTGLEIQTKHYALGVSFTDGIGPGDASDDDYKPTSTVVDYQLEGIFDRLMWSLHYQAYGDLYWVDQPKDSETQYHLDLVSYGLGVQYALNEKVNIKEVFGSTSKNKVKGSSWLTGFQLNHSEVKSNNTIVPTDLASDYQEVNELTRIKTNSAALNFGWGGQYLYKSYFINTKILYGLAYQEQTLINGEERVRHYPANHLDLTFDTGFVFTQSIFGLRIFAERITSNMEEQDIVMYRANSQFYYRYFF